jgi:hypothetical protein
MPANVSPTLLVTYLSAAARQAAEGEPLTERSLWAIAHARRQLQGDCDELSGVAVEAEASHRAAMRTSSAPISPGVADIALRAAKLPPDARSIEDRERWAAQYLSDVVADLERLSAPAPDPAIAQRVRALFSTAAAMSR